MRRYNDEVKCRKCGEMCVVEGDYPRFDAWCNTCGTYADTDMHEYTIDYISSQVDHVYDSVREHGWNNDK